MFQASLKQKHEQNVDHHYRQRPPLHQPQGPLNTAKAQVRALQENGINVNLLGDDFSGSSELGDERSPRMEAIPIGNPGSSWPKFQPDLNCTAASAFAAPRRMRNATAPLT